MPKWLVRQTLKELKEVDNKVESGKLTEKQHDKLSKKAVEKSLAIEKNITKKEDKEIIGKLRR